MARGFTAWIGTYSLGINSNLMLCHFGVRYCVITTMPCYYVSWELILCPPDIRGLPVAVANMASQNPMGLLQKKYVVLFTTARRTVDEIWSMPKSTYIPSPIEIWSSCCFYVSSATRVRSNYVWNHGVDCKGEIRVISRHRGQNSCTDNSYLHH